MQLHINSDLMCIICNLPDNMFYQLQFFFFYTNNAKLNHWTLQTPHKVACWGCTQFLQHVWWPWKIKGAIPKYCHIVFAMGQSGLDCFYDVRPGALHQRYHRNVVTQINKYMWMYIFIRIRPQWADVTHLYVIKFCIFSLTDKFLGFQNPFYNRTHYSKSNSAFFGLS